MLATPCMPTESTLDSLTRRLEELEIEAKTIKDTVEALKIAQAKLKGQIKIGDRVRILNPTFFPYFNNIEKDSNGTVTSISKKGRICILTDNGERTNRVKKNVTKLLE